VLAAVLLPKMSQCADFDRDTSGFALKVAFYAFYDTARWFVYPNSNAVFHHVFGATHTAPLHDV